MTNGQSEVVKTATKVECIIDDDEGLTSFCVWWGPVGSYFALARETGSPDIHCEFEDQANGFYPKTLKYRIRDHVIEFSLEGNEVFARRSNLQRLSIRFLDDKMLNEARKVLSVLFS